VDRLARCRTGPACALPARADAGPAALLEPEPEQAAALARRLLDADPLDEDAVVALLAAQRELGLLEEQREAYRSFALRLDEELGVEPSSRVREQLRKPAPAGAASGEGFVGRSRELDEVCALLARGDCRLLSVVGPGGVGKSRLMKQVLRRLEPRFAGGALWIALDDLSDSAQVVARIAAELKLAPGVQQGAAPDGLRATRVEAAVARARQLRAPRRPAAAGRAAARSRAGAHDLRHLASAARGCGRTAVAAARAGAGTRRCPARRAAGERRRASVRRCRERGQARLRCAAEAAAIGALVKAVGGLPLAILLAAHWVRLLSVTEIVAELERSIDVLDSGDEGEERPEHRSMRATFERSWQMLATREQQTLATLSVFVGTFSIQAAREIADAALPLLAALADKSLLQMPAGSRCSLHPLIRQFAAEALTGDAAAQALRRHADWFNRLLARLAVPAEAGHAAACDEIEAELENCRLAWRWAVAAHAAGTLAGGVLALMRYFEMRGLAAEGAGLLAEALPLCDSPATPSAHAAELLSAVAHLQFRQYRLDEAAASARHGLKHARASARRGALLRCLNVLGLCHWKTGRHQEARRFLEQALRHARAGNDRHAETLVLGNLASVDKALGDYDRCLLRSLEVLEQQRRLGEWVGVAIRLNNLADLHQARGEWTEARACLDEGLDLCRRHGIAFVRPHLLVNWR
jgi:tetratricopeptide (TPR) repeat protein